MTETFFQDVAMVLVKCHHSENVCYKYDGDHAAISLSDKSRANSHRLRLAGSDFGGNRWNDTCTLEPFPPVRLQMRQVEGMALLC